MAIVFRVLYNNQDWAGKCTNVLKDSRCVYCISPNVDVTPKINSKGDCEGSCWESRLRVDLKWGCIPKGNYYHEKALNMPVFFVFKQPDKKQTLYTLWATSKVIKIDKGLTGEYNFLHFESFEPIFPLNWIEGLTDIELVGKPWGSGRHRYIKDEQEQYLLNLIERQRISRGSTSTDYTVDLKIS